MDNPELGRKVLDHVTGHPELFKMSTWGQVTECGTAGCLAGHTMLQDGYSFDEDTSRFVRPDGSTVSSGAEGDEAARLLGLTVDEQYDEGWDLFSAAQTEDHVAWFRSIVEASEAIEAASGA